MKNFVILVCCILCVYHTFGQTILFEDHFDNNAKGWIFLPGNSGKGGIKAGKLMLTPGKYSDANYRLNIQVPTTREHMPAGDFSISVKMNWLSGTGGDPKSGSGFWIQKHNFLLSADCSIVHELSNNKTQRIALPAGKCNALGANDFKVVVIYPNAFVFVNNECQYATLAYKGELQKNVDLYAAKTSTVEFDDLVIKDGVSPEERAVCLKYLAMHPIPADIRGVAASSGSGAAPVAAVTAAKAIEGLTDTIVRNGITIPVHPAWKQDESFKKYTKLYKLTNIPSSGTGFSTLSIYSSIKPGTVNDELLNKKGTMNYVLERYYKNLPATGKNLVKPASSQDGIEQHIKRFVVQEPFTTAEGNAGQILLYEYKEVSNKLVTQTFLALACVANATGNQVATVQLEFTTSSELAYHDFAKESVFTQPDYQKEWKLFVSSIFKSMKVKFNNSVIDIGSFTRQCTDTIVFKNAVVNVNPEWKKLTGYTYPGSRALSLAEAWKAKATFPVSIRLEKFHVYLATATGTVQSKASSLQSTQRYLIKDFYTKLNGAGLSNLSAEEIEKATEQELAASLSVEDITTLQGRKAKLTAKESRSITNPMVYYSFEVTALTESTVPNEYFICSFTFSMAKMLDQFSAQKQSMFATPDEKKACIDFCRELAKTLKVK